LRLTMPIDSLTELAKVISEGLPAPEGGLRPRIEALFGDRYQKRHLSPTAVRDAYGLANDDTDGVPYAGLINPDIRPRVPTAARASSGFRAVKGALSSTSASARAVFPRTRESSPGPVIDGA